MKLEIRFRIVFVYSKNLQKYKRAEQSDALNTHGVPLNQCCQEVGRFSVILVVSVDDLSIDAVDALGVGASMVWLAAVVGGAG